MSLTLEVVKGDGETDRSIDSKSICRRTRLQESGKNSDCIIPKEEDEDVEHLSENNSSVVANSGNHPLESHSHTPGRGERKTSEQTPRRSARKSVMKVQQYEDIINHKRQLRSFSKAVAEHMEEITAVPQPKWSPAKVGRVSLKRGRKSRKTTVGDENESLNKQEGVKQVIENENGKQVHDFGTLLKANTSDMADLGLTSLNSEVTAERQDMANVSSEANNVGNVDAEDKQPTDEITATTTEAASIITETDTNTAIKKEIDDINNSDCILISPEKADLVEDEIQSLQIVDDTDDENSWRPQCQTPRIVLTNDEGEQQTLNTTTHIALTNDEGEQQTLNTTTHITLSNDEGEQQTLNTTHIALSNDEGEQPNVNKTTIIARTNDEGVQRTLNISTPIKRCVTPKRYAQTVRRMPTPFKVNDDARHNEDDSCSDDLESDVSSLRANLSILEPKEIVLRSIRKRSLSVCIGEAESDIRRAKLKNVTFYSPANQTTLLEDMDIRIEKSVKKSEGDKMDSQWTFVTQRRKRSMSFDEACAKKKQQTQSYTPDKTRSTPQKNKPLRSKLPNFAAIHQKQFDKMENLVDHVNRKAERAKILTNSATKSRIASAQKPMQITTATAVAKSTPLKRPNSDNNSTNKKCSAISNISMQKLANTTRRDTESKHPSLQLGICKPIVLHTKEANITLNNTMRKIVETQKENHEAKLPNPQLGIIKPVMVSIAGRKNKQLTPGKNVSMATHLRPATRPVFKLSTSAETYGSTAKHTNVVPPFNNKVAKANTTTAVSAPTISSDGKIADRRQRHMDMFKGRNAVTPTAGQYYGQLIRGVRSNRRFELQMQHRLNMENN